MPFGQYTSTISQADADQKAINAVNANGQANANANGTCSVDYSNWITYIDFPTYSDTFAVSVAWNKDLVSTPTVKFEVYQDGVFKAVVQTNVPNTGSATLSVLPLLTITGNNIHNVKLKMISEADPSISDFSFEVNWQLD